jgi:hypothetical protein
MVRTRTEIKRLKVFLKDLIYQFTELLKNWPQPLQTDSVITEQTVLFFERSFF